MPEGTNRRAVYGSYGGPEVLYVEESERPRAGKGELLIRQLASSVNGGDLSIRAGHAKPMAAMITPGWPKSIGMDVVGMIEEIGSGVEGWNVGDLVWGVSTGSNSIAEFVTMKAGSVALAPLNLETKVLGALPVAGTTAMACVGQFANVQPGERVLVRGAAGGVGSAIVQLARARGGRVTALASASTREAVLALGAEEVLDYREAAPEVLPEFDVIIDTVGSDLERFRSRLALGGRFVTITIDFKHPARGVLAVAGSAIHGSARIRQMVSTPGTKQLATLTALVEAGTLRPVIDSVYPLDEIAAAHERAEQHGTVGKIVIEI